MDSLLTVRGEAARRRIRPPRGRVQIGLSAIGPDYLDEKFIPNLRIELALDRLESRQNPHLEAAVRLDCGHEATFDRLL
jgi:hypothetical protein